MDQIFIFNPSLFFTSGPLTFSLVNPPPPPLPCVNKYRGMYSIYSVCKVGDRVV
jgi:hypothetical protein